MWGISTGISFSNISRSASFYANHFEHLSCFSLTHSPRPSPQALSSEAFHRQEKLNSGMGQILHLWSLSFYSVFSGCNMLLYTMSTPKKLFFFSVKNKTESQTREQTCGCQGGEGWRRDGGVEWELGVSRCKLLYVEYMKSQVLRYSTGNYIQCPVCVLSRSVVSDSL